MNRHGTLLLEVVAALWILALAGVAGLQLTRAAVGRSAATIVREHELRAAERLLLASLLATSQELDQRIGIQRQGPFLVTVQRPVPGLYRVSVARVDFPDVELLVTVAYRRSEMR